MQVSAKLRRASAVMAWLSLAGAAFYVAGDFLVFLAPDIAHGVGFFQMRAADLTITSAMPLAYRAAALAIDLIPTALMVWALAELFRLYAAGTVFTPTALGCLKRVASLMFWFVLVGFLTEGPISYIISLSQPHHYISLTLTSHDFATLFVAGVALVISRVMAEAQRLADENATFV